MLSYLYQKFTPYEWLLTNKKGGYALGTAFLANVRKYHGLLVAGKSQGKRYHLLAGLEESVKFPSGLTYQLDTNFYRDVVYPEGYKFIKNFFYLPYPTFYFYCPKTEAGLFLKKSLKFHPEKNCLLITYENISSYPYLLQLRPRFTFRDHHSLSSAPSWRDQEFENEGKTAFISKDDLVLFCYTTLSNFVEDLIFYYNVYYPLEAMRGYHPFEDHFSPFKLEVELSPGEKLKLLFSDEFVRSVEETIEEVENRYSTKPQVNLQKNYLDNEELLPLLSELVRAFLVKGNIIAGYPWFYAWGRDTFIGLPALFYQPDGLEVCLEIFTTYHKYMKNGVIPNLLGTEGEGNYYSMDASLWFALRIFEYLDFFDDKLSQPQRQALLSSAEEVIRGYLFAKEHPFQVDPVDGMLTIPEHIQLALTWMDVMLEGRPLTPRHEKPIEIEFLWYNILNFAKRWFPTLLLEELKINSLLEKLSNALLKYYNGELFADTIFHGEPIFEVRPNFVIALSLPFLPFAREALIKAIEIVKRELLTPYGLRSLSPRHPHFKRKYFGTQYQRDLAYHNGTVWVWLLYPYAQLLKKVLSQEEYLAEIRGLISPFLQLMRKGKIGCIPELYDGDQPYYPKGAPAQFWSTAAIYLLGRELFTET